MTDDLKDRNQQLQKALRESEQELAKYKSEISKLNIQLKELIKQINQEIQVSHVIQKALVPTEIPNIPGFDFSTKFIASLVAGGDYFDLFEHEDKFRFGIVLSSASGYGMSALFLSILMKFTGQMEARKKTTPSEALSGILKELLSSLQSEDTADVFYGIVDRRTFELSYCMAGNILALHVPCQQNQVVNLQAQAPTISRSSSDQLHTESLVLNAKDRLILCSKGVFDALNAKGESFGRQRLMDLVLSKNSSSVHDVRNEILFQIEKWTGKSEPDRDQTLLVVEVKDRILKLART